MTNNSKILIKVVGILKDFVVLITYTCIILEKTSNMW